MLYLHPERKSTKLRAEKEVSVRVVDLAVHLGAMHFQREHMESEVWYSAWFQPKGAPARRAPRLDCANARELGNTVGEIVAQVLNYGENGVLDPDLPAE